MARITAAMRESAALWNRLSASEKAADRALPHPERARRAQARRRRLSRTGIVPDACFEKRHEWVRGTKFESCRNCYAARGPDFERL